MKKNNHQSLYDRTGKRKYMNSNERSKYLVEAKKSDVAKRLFLLMLYYSGARISEVLNLTVAQIDRSENMVIIETLKKRKKGVYRAVPIPSNYILQLKYYIDSFPSEIRIWKYSRRSALRYVKTVMNEANISGAQACPNAYSGSLDPHIPVA